MVLELRSGVAEEGVDGGVVFRMVNEFLRWNIGFPAVASCYRYASGIVRV